MSRTATEIAEEMARFMPPNVAIPLDPYLGGIGASFAAAESAVEDMSTSTTVGGAAGVWLDLVALGDGLRRQDGESDADLQTRIRTPTQAVTVANLEAAANAILAQYGEDGAYIVEWDDDGFADVDAYADDTILVDPYNRFVLVLPLIGDPIVDGVYLDDGYADDEVSGYMGGGAISPVYDSIWAAIERLRAFGVRWSMYIQE